MAGTLLNNTINKTDANQQLASTINQGGLLMRMAKNQGAQAAGSRGLMNSSIGSEAAQRAIVASAQPLALQNTQFAQSKALNQQNADLTAKRDATQQQYNKENMAAQFGYSTKLNAQQNQFTASQNSLDRDQQINLANLNFKNQTALNNQQNTFTASQNALDRDQQVKLQNLQYQNQLGLLDAQGKQELEQLQQQFKNQTALNAQQNTFAASQNELDRAQQMALQNDAQSFTASQSDLDRSQQTNLANLNYQNQYNLNNQQNQFTSQRDSTLFKYDQQNKATDFANSLKTMSEQQKYDLQKLNAQTAASKDLAAQQQQYTLTNTAKQVAANTQGMYLDAINGLTSTFGDQVAAINASSMKASDKKNAINSLISAQNSMLKFYQSTYQNMSTIKDDWVNVDVKTLPTGSIAQLK